MYFARIAFIFTLFFTLTSGAGEPRLADAIEQADWTAVESLLDKNRHEVNAQQADNMTALHWAAWHDRLDICKTLVERGADVQAHNRYGVTPLAIACLNGNAEMVRLLLSSGADGNATLNGGETALMTAARTGRLAVVRALLEHGANVNAKEHRGQTAIMWAAAEGHADVVAHLLRAGANYPMSLKSGFTAFYFAVREGHAEVVELFLAQGQDVNEVMQPQTAGNRIVRRGTSPLILAIENGHFELAASLLEKGADPNDQRSGFTPLHVISWVRKPNLGDGVDGDPPPTGSGTMTSLQLVDNLVEHGADVNARLRRGRSGKGRLNHKGATPFLFAADTADVPLMKKLLDLGADPTIANADGCPPLLAAAGIGTYAPGEEAGAEEEALAAVRLLLDLGADINAVDKKGETAMHGAAYKSLPKMVALLSEHGADIKIWNTKNRYGWTPLLIAEGYRPGNFKPAAATIEAIHRAMRAAGVEPPPDSAPRPPRRNDNYSKKKNPEQKK